MDNVRLMAAPWKQQKAGVEAIREALAAKSREVLSLYERIEGMPGLVCFWRCTWYRWHCTSLPPPFYLVLFATGGRVRAHRTHSFVVALWYCCYYFLLWFW